MSRVPKGMNCQVWARISVGRAALGEPRKLIESLMMPSFSKTSLSIPNSGSRIHLAMMAMMTLGVIHGTSIAALAIVLPTNVWFKSRAVARGMVSCKMSPVVVQIKELTRLA